MLIFGSIAATGAGLHVAASYIGHEAHIGATATVMTVAVPVAVFVFALFALYTYLVQAGDPSTSRFLPVPQLYSPSLCSSRPPACRWQSASSFSCSLHSFQ